MNRIAKLADRKNLKIEIKNNIHKYNNFTPYYNLVALETIIAEAFGVGSASKKVKIAYEKLIKTFGNEIKILMEISDDELKQATDSRIAEGIKKVREGKLKIQPGYDGKYGKITILQ